jgi:hypothetical protein
MKRSEPVSRKPEVAAPNRIGRRAIMCMLLIAALAVSWNQISRQLKLEPAQILVRQLGAVAGGTLLRSWETAVTSWAGANGFARLMLFGTPFDAQSSASLPLM